MSEDFSQTLIGSQAIVFQRLSQVFSGSSITPDLLNESQLHGVENSNSLINKTIEDSFETLVPSPNAEDHEYISISQVEISGKAKVLKGKLKRTKNRRKEQPEKRRFHGPNPSNDSFTSCFDVIKEGLDPEPSPTNSVSLLKDCYLSEENLANKDFPNLEETCMHSQLEIVNESLSDKKEDNLMVNSFEKFDDNSDTGSDELIGNIEDLLALTPIEKVNKSCQTDSSIFFKESLSPREEQLHCHMQFIRSLITLMHMLSTKTDISKRVLCGILNSKFNLNVPSFYQEEDVIPRDVVRYMLRTANFDSAFETAVTSILCDLEIAIEKDLKTVAVFWKDSIYELAVKTLNEAVSCKPKLNVLLDSFLNRLITSILIGGRTPKNYAQETKAAFIVAFCASAYHRTDVINRIIEELKGLNLVRREENSSLSNMHTWTRFTKNSYFLIRILKKLLVAFGNNAVNGEMNGFDVCYSKSRNFGVLEVWKKHWRQADDLMERKEKVFQGQNQRKSYLRKWSEDLNEILVHSMVHLPVLASQVEKCVRLAQNLSSENRPDDVSIL